MKVYITSTMVYVKDKDLKSLERGRVYSVPDEWGKLMIKGEVACRYFKIGSTQQ